MGIPQLNDADEQKKLLSRFYNEINKEMYGFGVTRLKISIDESSVLFLAKQQRIMALKALEIRYAPMKKAVDHALHSEFKYRLQKKLETEAAIKVTDIMRSYDPSSEWASTLVILNK